MNTRTVAIAALVIAVILVIVLLVSLKTQLRPLDRSIRVLRRFPSLAAG